MTVDVKHQYAFWLFCLDTFGICLHKLFFFFPAGGVFYSFMWVNDIPLYEYTVFYLYIYQLLPFFGYGD